MARPCCEHDASPGQGRAQGALSACLVGNPNAGKTTLFNALTGARQRTGNWPGVTVQRREGIWRDAAGEIRFIDLPGIYALGGQGAGLDEAIAAEAIAGSLCDVLVNVVDASNLERNLYLTLQLAESGRPMVVALNMTDAAEEAGRPVDAAELEKRLGIPVVPLVAREGRGIEELIAAIRRAAREHLVPAISPPWPPPVQEAIDRLRGMLADEARRHGVDARWLAIRLLQGEPQAQQMASAAALSQAAKLRARLMKALKEVPDLLLADARYELAHELATAAIAAARRTRGASSPRHTFAERLDGWVMNRYLGPLIFLAVIYLLFLFTINVGGAFIDFFDIASGALFVDAPRQLLLQLGAPAWLIALFADGIGAGLQTVATFIPIVGFLFIGLTFLEDSGYMARAAFVADALMRRLGLPGQAFVPLIVGFGCNVPAVMAARTLPDIRARIATILMVPFMACGARLAVFALFAAAFFGTGGQNVIFALYLAGIAAAILTAWLARRYLLRSGEQGLPFIMELPPWRLPPVRHVLLHAWLRLKGFVFGAGRIIVIVVAILGMLNSLGTDGSFGNQNSEKSLLSAIGRQITPLFAPIGIREDNWPATVGLFTGIFAKEVVVGTLSALYGGMAEAAAQSPPQGVDLLAAMREALATIPANLAALKDQLLDPLGLADTAAPLEQVAEQQGVATSAIGAMVQYFDGRAGAFAYMLFVLLYFPCAATFAAIAREIGWRWAAFSAAWSLWLAFFAAGGFYQLATLARHPAASLLWLAVLALGMALMILFIRWLGRRGALPVRANSAAAE